MTSPLVSGSAGWSWRADGLLAGRTWPTGNSSTVTYDRLKRPTSWTELASGSNQAVFTQAFDRAGDIVSEGRTLSGISGSAGTGDQTFKYDKLHRVTEATLAGAIQTYAYDANGNRIGVTRAGVTTAYAYDRADQLRTKQVGAGTPTSFTYDTYGNLTSSQVSASGATAYAYTAADELLSIDPPGASNTVSLTKDALGRNRVRQVNGSTVDTYGYLGESDLVVRLARSSNSIDSAVSAVGERVAIKQGATSGWTLPDLHGSLAAMVGSSGASVTDAFRYDPYGELAASVTGGPSTPWRFNGSLLLTESGTTDLYAQGDRPYDPALGVFTQLDDVMGDAQDPFSLNRYLYAWANPVGMIDPSGHAPWVLYDDATTRTGPIATKPKPNPKPKPTGGSGSASSSSTAGNSGSGGDAGAPTANSNQAAAAPPVFVKGSVARQAKAWVAQQATGRVAWQRRGTDRTRVRSLAQTDPYGGCSIEALDCTASDFDKMSMADRYEWIRAFQAAYVTEGWFNNIQGFVRALRDSGASPGSWISWVDARVLTNIQNGYRVSRGRLPTEDVQGVSEMAAVFILIREARGLDAIRSQHVHAEQQSVNQGQTEAAGMSRLASSRERAGLVAANQYRSLADQRNKLQGLRNFLGPAGLVVDIFIGGSDAVGAFDTRNEEVAYSGYMATQQIGDPWAWFFRLVSPGTP